jgi:hypothetical protein
MAQYQVNTSASGIAAAAFNAGIESYGSFAGTDITAHINHVPIGTLMGVSYTIHTEKQAQYTFGSRNVRRFTTGKRGIAGTLVFNTFDRSALLAIFAGSNGIGQPLVDAFAQTSDGSLAINGNRYGELGDDLGPFRIPSTEDFYSSNSSASSNFNNSIGSEIQDAYANAFTQPLDYADQLPPFDVTLTMLDNQGAGAYMVIGGVEVMNEGGGFTVDDLTNQTAYTYVAKYVRPLTPITGAVNATANAIPKVVSTPTS